MEPGMYLTALVFAVAVLHLLNNMIRYVGSFRATSGKRSNVSSKLPTHRDDWYMFFYRSSLTGKAEKKIRNTQGKTTISSSFKRNKKRDSRPVLRHYLT